MAFLFPSRYSTPIHESNPRKAQIPPGMCPVPKDVTQVDDQGLLNLHRGFHLLRELRKVQAGQERVTQISRSWYSVPIGEFATRWELNRTGVVIASKYMAQLEYFETKFSDAFADTIDEKRSSARRLRKKPDHRSPEIIRGCSKAVIRQWPQMTVGEVEDLGLVLIPLAGPNPMKEELEKRGMLRRGRLAD